MFIISLSYIAPEEEVDSCLDAHITFLKEQYEKGIFLLSGRKIPRTGGIILATCSSKDELIQLVKKDPFVQHKVADFEIIEFNATMAGKDLASLLD